MKLELKPEVLELVKRQGTTATNAGMSRDGQISWIYTAGLLEVTLAHTNEILATWRFGKILKDMHTTITCVTDFTFCGDCMLVVATSSFTNQGTLNIFSVGLRKVIRAVEVPQRVTAIDVVFTNINEDVPSWILSKHLQFFSGLLAVGTEAGYVYLVDLCLDELMATHSTEAVPKKLTVISPSIVDPKAKREQARLYDRHLAMLLDDQCHRQGHFYYRRQDDIVQKIFDEDTVTVTSIKYLSQAGALAVGFNFGSFQLWRLYNPVLDYSSRFSPDGVAVSNFVVQEPENDPRNFVYLWVGHDDLTGDSVSSICLYQLSFTRKNVYPNFGMYYDELESVCARLDHKLTLDPYNSDTRTTRSSSIVSCCTIVNPYYIPPSKLSDSFEEGLHSNDLSLSVFVWRAESKRAGGAVRYWMCIFDLNRWYHAQMPHTLRCRGNSLQVCSYWIACNLDEVVSLASPSATLLGVGISGDKVLRFINNSPLPPEEHSYPSSLQLTSIQFITSDSCINARCDGWQGQLLSQLAHNGAQILVQPADFYHQCHRARLLPQNYEELKTGSVDYQRTVLLNMALEHGITSTLVPLCIQQWADGEFAEQGCSLSFLLNWAWDRVGSIKQTWDTTCEMLYDWSGHHLDSRTDWQLEFLTESLSNLKQVFSALITQSSPTTERGGVEMEMRQDVVSILLLHYNVVRWCVSFSLLPEIDEASEPQSGLFSFPINSLLETYTKKRTELSSMKGIVKDFSLLLIDDFLDCQGQHIQKLWKSLGGNGLYPPPSIQAVVNMYLIEEVSTEVKHAVTLYLLQDLAALTKNEAEEAVIASFIQRFMLSPGLVHQIQGLWFIDHRDFEEGVRHLVNPNIHEDLGGSWKHVAVVNTLLAQSEGKAATRYLHTKGVLGGSPQEQQLYISVLLDDRQVSQALEYMRGCQNDSNCAQLLNHLLNECHKCKLLGLLLQLSLSDSEEVSLEQYLRGRAEPHALEPLLLYYLHHSRFLQAFQLNEDMKKMDRLETSLVAQERAATRNRLMEAYLRALPDVTYKLLIEKQRGSIAAAKRVDVQRPKPLSTKVHSSDHVAMSRSHFVMAVLEKVTEAQNMVASGDMTDVNECSIARDATESRSSVPFLSTPRTNKHKAYSRVSEAFYPDLKLSPLATNPLSAVKRRTVLEAKDGQLNGNISLRQLTEECLQLLHTPIRNHKRKSGSPCLAASVSHIKTPQSILKVQRLSKTLHSVTTKDKPSARRSSLSRPSKLGFSLGNSPPASPTNSPPPKKFDSPTPFLVSAENTAVKHLRFVGISPSPTPSPTMASSLVSAEKSQGVFEMDNTSPPWLPIVMSAETVIPSRQFLSEEVSRADHLSRSTNLLGIPSKEAQLERSSSDATTKDVLYLDREHQSFVERPSDRHDNEFDLVRPGLQTQWKQGSQLDLTEHSPLALSETSLSVGSKDVVNVTGPVNEEVMEFVDQSGRESRRTTHVVEQVSSSQNSTTLTSSYSQEVVKTTTKYVQLSIDPDLSVSHLQDTLTPANKLNVGRNLPSLLVSSSHNLRSQKSSVSPKSLKADVSGIPYETESRRHESPPVTPPTSKRAKLLESMAKEVENLRKKIILSQSPEKSGDESLRRKTSVLSSFEKSEHVELRRKTPERKSPSRKIHELEDSEVDDDRIAQERKSPPRKLQKLDEDAVYEDLQKETQERRSLSRKVKKLEENTVAEELKRKTPERRSPSRKLKNLEEDTVDEELKRKTPERRSQSRQLKNLEEDTVDEELKRKTPERRSPSRKLKNLEEDTVDEELKRKTPERRSPSRKVKNLEEDTVDEELQRRKPERRSPSRKFKNLEEDTVDEELQRKTPERRSPSRKVKKLEEITEERMQRKTPERKSPSRKLQKLEDKSEKVSDVLVKSVPSPRAQMTPDRQSVTMRLSESGDDQQNISVEAEGTDVPTYRNHQNTFTIKAAEDKDKRIGEPFGADEESSQVDASEGQEKWRLTRLNTPDRAGDSRSDLESLSPARGRGRALRTPQKVVQIHDGDEGKIEAGEKLSSSRRSTKKTISDLAESMEKSKSELSKAIHSVGKKVDIARSPERLTKKQNDEKEGDEIEIHNLRRSRRQSKTPDRLAQNVDNIEPLTPTRRSRRLPKTSESAETESVKASLESPKRIVKGRASSREQDVAVKKPESLKPSLAFTQQLKSGDKSSEQFSSEDPEAHLKGLSPSRSAKVVSREEESEPSSSPARRSIKEELEESSLRSKRKTPDRQLRDTDIEQSKVEVEEAHVTRAKSPGRSRKSPARQTSFPARQTRSPARNIKASDEDVEINKELEGNNGDDNADGWSEEMPALRLEVEDDINSEGEDHHVVVDVIEKAGRQSETPDRFLRGHKKKTGSTTSEDPLISSSPRQLTKTAKKSARREDLANIDSPTFVFSPPLKHSMPEHQKQSSEMADEGKFREQVFVFSHPTVAADSDSGGNTEITELKTETTVTVETKRKSKKKRTLLSYSPILLSPLSPAAVRRSHRHMLVNQNVTVGAKFRGPRTRRIKPSTWTQPPTSRQ